MYVVAVDESLPCLKSSLYLGVSGVVGARMPCSLTVIGRSGPT